MSAKPFQNASFTRKPLALALALALLAPTFSTLAYARVALVIGNSAYPQSPLDNPANDAKAIAQALREAGFEVDLLLDQKRDAMQKSITNFGTKLAAKKQPSVFYFAGHALQLNWRNYLLPTDLAIRKAEDVGSQAVDLNDLLGQLSKAALSNGGNSNIVILDACRDNPFGNSSGAAKGLTQMDAPTGTLLAYATAPGSVAQDAGSGANGLYTENLLIEMRTEGAKIEDVLKRVRLSVRIKSNGAQVPWESTSLEEDFYFKPPRVVAKLSGDEAEKAFEEELLAWTVARAAVNSLGLEDFIRRYPSGKFSELAQYRLDNVLQQEKKKTDALRTAAQARAAQEKAEAQLLSLRERERVVALAVASADEEAKRAAKLEQESLLAKQRQAEREATAAREQLAKASAPAAPIASAPAATAAPGSIEAILAAALGAAKEESKADDFPAAKPGEIRQGWQNGDLMVYRETPQSGLLRIESTVRQRVQAVFNTMVRLRSGNELDHFGSPRGRRGDSASSDMQMLIHDYQVGKKWSTRFQRGGSNGAFWIEADAKVIARETLDTPAGKFETYKVSIVAKETNGSRRQFTETWWIDTVSRKPIAYDKRETEADGFVRDHRKGVLIAFENDGRVDRD